MSKFFTLSLLFIFNSVTCSTFIKDSIIDLRRSCLGNISSDLYLPTQSGKINSYVIFVSTKFIKPLCNLNVYSSTADVRLLFVLEFLEGAQCKEHEIVLYGNNTTTDICTNQLNQGVYKHRMLVEKLSIFFNIQENDSRAVKIVVTAATLLSNNFRDCEKLNKINCGSSSTGVCIDKSLQCDGDFNCGAKFGLDEDKIICGVVQEKMWLVMIFTLLFVSYNMLLFYRFLKKRMTPIPEDFFIVDEKPDKLTIKPQMKPPHVKISASHFKDHLRISLTDEPSEPIDDSKNVSHEDCVPSSSITEDWLSAESFDKKIKFRKARRKKFPVFSKAEVPSYEKRLSERMKMKMLTSTTSEDEKPKITFYAATTKLS